MNYKRDTQGRPIKPPIMGSAWSPEDLNDLVDSLLVIAGEEGPNHALELLDHGYRSTSMNAEIYDKIKTIILDSQVGKP